MASIATFPSPREPLPDLAPPDDRRLAATVLVVDDDHGVTTLFSRLLTASGCTVPSFDGGYLFAHLERHSDSTLRVLLKRGDGPVQAMVDAVLTGEGFAPPSPPAPPAALASIPGEWSGTVAWRSQQNVRGEPHVGINVHQALDLSIAEGGALTGTGFGCTFTGSLSLVGSSASHASGTVEASGCTEPVFNGVFSQAMVTIEGTGQLRVHLGRQSQDATGQSQVLIEGPLVSSAP